MRTALAISPHLDDALFSAGGTLARLVRRGWRVVVATVFTASVPDPRGFALACQLDKGLAADVDYMALRRREDAAACASIGAETLWLPFAEAPHRGYDSAPRLFAGLREDDGIVDELEPALLDVVRGCGPDLILSPQSIGAHVDHVAVHLALRSLAVPRWLWVDFPYLVRPASGGSPFAAEFVGLARRRLDLSPDEVDAKARAVLAYESQLGFQFGGPSAADATIRRSGHVESFCESATGATGTVPGWHWWDIAAREAPATMR